MERRLAKKIRNHFDDFKNDIEQWLQENDIKLVSDGSDEDCIDRLKVFMGNYGDVTFTKEDFLKRKRVKNMAPQCERCMAKRADGTQCTRRKKNGQHYCGTHIKGTPHGNISLEGDEAPTTKQIETTIQEINGIDCFIDNEGNIYKHSDVMQNKVNPEIVGRWEKQSGEYVIKQINT